MPLADHLSVPLSSMSSPPTNKYNDMVNIQMNTSLSHRLFIASIIRVLAVCFILFLLDVPIYVKIILILLTDALDSGVPRLLYRDWISASTDTYQRTDKITDTICYVLLFLYLIRYAGLSCQSNYALMFLLAYRIVGTGVFLIKNDRKYLFYFPNFFLEISLGLVLIHQFASLQRYTTFILLCIVVYKLSLEYFMHVFAPRHRKNIECIKSCLKSFIV